MVDQPPPRPRRRAAAVVLAVLLAAVPALSACTGSGGGGAATAPTRSAAPSPARSASGPAEPAGPAGSLQAQYEAVIGKVLPSVVEITTSTGLGSGIVFDAKGDIVTNDHVVGTATRFQVRFANSARTVDATLVGAFPGNDLAVIKVSGVDNLHPATFADSAEVGIGQIVLAMGNPLGLSSSVTEGIVSALGRTLSEPKSADSPGATLPNAIQTSAAINPGNSGGALVNLDGEVIGIPTLAATSQQDGGAAPGIGFAIPSDTVTRIAKQLIAHGRVTNSGRAALGIGVRTVLDLSGAPAGAAVYSVQPGGAAARAGIRVGDVVTEVHGVRVRSAQELGAVLANLRVGQQVPVQIVRGGSTRTIQVRLGELTS